MGEPLRRDGRFVGRFDRLTLYEIVEARQPNPREAYRLIASGEAATTREIAEIMGRHRDVVVKWVRPLKYLGWIEETTKHTGRGGKRTWYSVTDVEPEW